MRQIVPNGAKIKELRNGKGFKQQSFAEDVGMSERQLREIENRNKPTPEHKAREIAQKLGVDMSEIRLRVRQEKSGATEIEGQSAEIPKADPEVALRRIKSGKRLGFMAKLAQLFLWDHETEPDLAMASRIEAVVLALDQEVEVGLSDPRTQLEVLRVIARINQAIAELEAVGIGVFANYVQVDVLNDKDRGSRRREGRLYVRFAPLDGPATRRRKLHMTQVDPETGRLEEDGSPIPF